MLGDVLSPGGWIEDLKPESPVCVANDEGNAIAEPERNDAFYPFTDYVREAASKTGIETLVARRFRDMLEKQGFVNVREGECEVAHQDLGPGGAGKETGVVDKGEYEEFCGWDWGVAD